MGPSPQKLFLCLALMFALTGCKDEPGKHFEMSADDVFLQLLSDDIPRTIQSKQYSEMGEHRRVDYDGDALTVTWRRMWKDRERYRYHVRVIANEDNTSRVIVEFIPGEGLSQLPRLSQKQTYGAVTEHIYSYLEGRPFNGLNIQTYTMAYAAANMSETVEDLSKEAEKAKALAREFNIQVPD